MPNFVYRSNIATLNQLKEWYSCFACVNEVNIFSRNNEPLVSWGMKHFKAIYHKHTESKVDLNKEFYIIGTKLLDNSYSIMDYSSKVNIIIDFKDELAHYYHEIGSDLSFLDSLYYYYSNKGIASIDVYTEVPVIDDPSAKKKIEIHLFNIDLSCENVEDAIVLCDFKSDHPDAFCNISIQSILKQRPGWIYKTTLYTNGFRFDQYLTKEGLTDEKLSIYTDCVIYLDDFYMDDRMLARINQP